MMGSVKKIQGQRAAHMRLENWTPKTASRKMPAQARVWGSSLQVLVPFVGGQRGLGGKRERRVLGGKGTNGSINGGRDEAPFLCDTGLSAVAAA